MNGQSSTGEGLTAGGRGGGLETSAGGRCCDGVCGVWGCWSLLMEEVQRAFLMMLNFYFTLNCWTMFFAFCVLNKNSVLTIFLLSYFIPFQSLVYFLLSSSFFLNLIVLFV